MKHSFWGQEFSSFEIQKSLTQSKFKVKECKSINETINLTANYISRGAVVGWFQGRSEWGPRALGNRSILANPAISSMKDTLNKKKKRETFRPFAPSVLKEDVSTIFEQDVDSPFMMHVVKFKEKFRQAFPSVTHVDGTGRIQTVDKENNLIYYKLLVELKKLIGYGIVLNTSFNENEPIVETPEQAISCFNRTDMDILVVGNFVLTKNSKDYSEFDMPN